VSSSQPEVINVPCFKDFTGVATLPAGTVVTGTEYAVLAVTTMDAAFDVPDDPAAGTRLLSTAISVTPTTVTLGNPAIATTVTSPSMINPGHTYEAELYLLLFSGGTPSPQTKDFQLHLVPNGHTISFNVINPGKDTFPAGPIAYVIIYQNN
jgi:hypothetical protein